MARMLRERNCKSVFALDTNTVIYYLRDAGRVGERMRASSPLELGIPAIVRYELEVGTHRGRHSARQRRVLDGLFRDLRTLVFDDLAAEASAEVWDKLHARGTMIGPLDALIAGTAIAHRATLVTHNTAEFKRVPGLKIVDWY